MKIEKEAMFYRKLDRDYVKCDLCPHDCQIPDGKVGRCRVRKNEEGTLYSLNYGKITSFALDPIEKKPLYHFYPGSRILSIGSFGCNLTCSFCQNWQIAHREPEATYVTPEQLVQAAQAHKDHIGIAYTYNEPSIWYEFIYETAPLIHAAGMKNVLVTNGFIKEAPLRKLLPHIDAMNIDLKGFTNDFYKDLCGGALTPVKETIETAFKSCHMEITTLLVSESNDSFEEIEGLAKWIGSISREIPLHLSRYFPAYKMELPPTPMNLMKEAETIAKKYLDYVYLGNIAGVDRNTYCPQCREEIVHRDLIIKVQSLDGKKCKKCNKPISIVY
ncbi:MAG: AmmeMemoRadiSam system radical enzyme [Anaerosolibacter sp.]|jgi:pyruvate formate lyase activating enzyme|uniref:AmmeMemoRadiSam system radical SAM enzyme n=1 Tax=Anaerosolibacter sp. TaxID=1872527 RepID=UPI002635B291|nr:AmmeMemoRadiSam system radical SAM enzyme [Anaerosolibacter sp.]MDF2547320.1 AmmeMemoRadiSam system radical enzyme [Anaerosolibacter sp.]